MWRLYYGWLLLKRKGISLTHLHYFRKVLNLYTKPDGIRISSDSPFKYVPQKLFSMTVFQSASKPKKETKPREWLGLSKKSSSQSHMNETTGVSTSGLVILPLSVTHMIPSLTNLHASLHSCTKHIYVCHFLWDLCFLLEHGAGDTL